jgi:cyanophycinase-like exopeptidase
MTPPKRFHPPLEGVHLAGTSTGAAFLCEHMITFGGEPVSLIGVRLHVLLQGATYDLQTRTATATSLTAGDR